MKHVFEQFGRIEIICGSMFSGKSEELIRRIRRSQFARQNVVAFKPMIDNRYEETCICSHDGNKVIAYSINKSSEIYDYVSPETDVIAIDEVQFFDDKIVEVCEELAEEGYRVIVAGLDLDFRAMPFASVPRIMAIAEKVTKLQAICHTCGAPAWCSQRLIEGEPAPYESEIIQVGASESYEARCRKHHEVPGRVRSR